MSDAILDLVEDVEVFGSSPPDMRNSGFIDQRAWMRWLSRLSTG